MLPGPGGGGGALQDASHLAMQLLKQGINLEYTSQS